MINYPFMNPSIMYPTSGPTDSRLSTPYRVNAEHYISPTCYINIEPEWLGMNYYFSSTPTVIPNVPRGFSLNEFTVNPAGELASSLEFVYTEQWVWVYQILRVSNNTIVVDEATALDGSLVLFNLNGSSIVDESDSFFGQGNNGRDCIQQASTYEYDLTSCFFQNDQSSYPVDQYLLGNVVTTGIARYTNKFEFLLNTWGTTLGGQPFMSYEFSLIPLDTADFTFSINSTGDGSLCPKLIFSNSTLQTCTYMFFYTGGGTVTFGQLQSSTSNTVTFGSNFISNAVAATTFLSYQISVNTVQCLILTCSNGNTVNITDVSTQKFDLVLASDLALNESVAFVTSQTAASVAQLNGIQDTVDQAKANLTYIQNALGILDFNTTKIVPYQDFQALREKTDALINSLSPAGTRDCANGVFGSVGCWFEDAMSTLIILAIVIAVAIGLYCLCIKFNLCGNLCSKAREF